MAQLVVNNKPINNQGGAVNPPTLKRTKRKDENDEMMEVALAAGGVAAGALVINSLMSSSSNSTPPMDTGAFAAQASGYNGIEYQTSSGVWGYLKDDGKFTYNEGDKVTFKVGEFKLGEVDSASFVKEGEVATVELMQALKNSGLSDAQMVNVAQFLMSLDSDGNPDTITISEDVAKLLSDKAFLMELMGITLDEEGQIITEGLTAKQLDFLAKLEAGEPGIDVAKMSDDELTALISAIAEEGLTKDAGGAYELVDEATAAEFLANELTTETPIDPDAPVLTGYFIDSPVMGLNYVTSSDPENVLTTGEDGAFQYRDGETITFAVGNMIIGEISSANINADNNVFIQDLLGLDRNATDDPQVVKVAQLLQSLDSDANPANGIDLTDVAQTLSVALTTLQITEIGDLTNENIQALVEALNEANPGLELVYVDEATAIAHLDSVLAALSEPKYEVNPVEASAEVNEVEFGALLEGQSITVAGLTLTAVADMTSNEVAMAFANLEEGSNSGNSTDKGEWSGMLSGYSTSDANGSTVDFISVITGSDQPLFLTESAGADAVEAPANGLVSHSTIQGSEVMTETSMIEFPALTEGQSLTVAGLTLTALTTLTADQVAASFASLSAGVTGVSLNNANPEGMHWSGSLSAGWSSGVASGAMVDFTSTTADQNVTDIATSVDGRQSALAPSVNNVKVDGALDVTETNDVTFVGLIAGQSVTVGGLTLTAMEAMSATEIATAFANLANGVTADTLNTNDVTTKGFWSGSLTGWSTGASGAESLTFTSATPNDDVADLTSSSDGRESVLAAAGSLGVVTTDGVNGTSEETADITFVDLTAGQSVTVDGLTLTAMEAMSASEIATAFSSLSAGTTGASLNDSDVTNKGFFSGALSANWTSGVSVVDDLTFTSVIQDNVTDIVTDLGGSALVADATDIVVNTNDGSTAALETNTLTMTALVEGQSVTVGGLTLTAFADMTANQVASAFANLTEGADAQTLNENSVSDLYQFSGELIAGWTSGAAVAGNVVFSSTTNGDATDLLVELGAATAVEAPVDVSKSTLQGATNVTERNIVDITDGLIAGQSITIAGLTLTAKEALTATEIASLFSGLPAGSVAGGVTTKGEWSGMLSTNWRSTAMEGDKILFTSTQANMDINDSLFSYEIAGKDAVEAPDLPNATTKVQGEDAYDLVGNWEAGTYTNEMIANEDDTAMKVDLRSESLGLDDDSTTNDVNMEKITLDGSISLLSDGSQANVFFGEGEQTLVFDAANQVDNGLWINNMGDGDVLAISGIDMATLIDGSIDTSDFVKTDDLTADNTEGAKLILDQNDGKLYFDANGGSTDDKVHLFTLDEASVAAVTYEDFRVI